MRTRRTPTPHSPHACSCSHNSQGRLHAMADEHWDIADVVWDPALMTARPCTPPMNKAVACPAFPRARVVRASHRLDGECTEADRSSAFLLCGVQVISAAGSQQQQQQPKPKRIRNREWKAVSCQVRPRACPIQRAGARCTCCADKYQSRYPQPPACSRQADGCGEVVAGSARDFGVRYRVCPWHGRPSKAPIPVCYCHSSE